MFRRIVILIILLTIPTAVLAWYQDPPHAIQECSAQIPWGMPSTESHNTVICRHAYILEYDGVAKIPKWVAYTLTPQHAIGCLPRTDMFAEDSSIPNSQRAELSDYAKSGFDIGHLANAADMSFDKTALQESFILTNMSPQLPGLNRGIWKVLEVSIRAWAWSTQHNFTIYNGNIYTIGKSKTIGENSVVVPDYLYKIVIDNTTRQVQVFLFPHREGQGTDLSVVLSTVAEIEQMSGIIFPMPPGVDKTAKPLMPWPADFKSVADAKKAQCKTQ